MAFKRSFVLIITIGYGDNNVTKRLNEVMSYGPRFLVKKIEYKNHILRNYSQKLMNLTKLNTHVL